MKRVDDKNRLSGPGTEANVVPGMMQMGGIIPERYAIQFCSYNQICVSLKFRFGNFPSNV